MSTKSSSLDAEHYLLSAKLLKEKIPNPDEYPFNLDVIHNLDTIEFHPKVTFIIGENGTGKSTLLEAIAIAYGFNPEGGTKNFNFRTRSSHSELHKYLRLSKSFRQAKDGFFLRAESFYNVASNIDQLDEEPGFGPPIKNSYGGKSLHNQSHGESFFSLMLNRFGGNGLYILDEPEAALSPARQIAMLDRMNELTKNKSQFIIATHSPILLSYQNSKIKYITEDGQLKTTAYEETDHYITTRNFINNYRSFSSKLFQ